MAPLQSSIAHRGGERVKEERKEKGRREDTHQGHKVALRLPLPQPVGEALATSTASRHRPRSATSGYRGRQGGSHSAPRAHSASAALRAGRAGAGNAKRRRGAEVVGARFGPAPPPCLPLPSSEARCSPGARYFLR